MTKDDHHHHQRLLAPKQNKTKDATAFTSVCYSKTQSQGFPGYWRDPVLTQLGLVEDWPSLGLRESLLQTQSWEGSTAEALNSLEAKFPPSCILLHRVRKGHLSC